jgi:hypothetical protein
VADRSLETGAYRQQIELSRVGETTHVDDGNATFCGTTLAARMAAVVRVGPHRAGHGVMQKMIGDVKRP